MPAYQAEGVYLKRVIETPDCVNVTHSHGEKKGDTGGHTHQW